MARFAPRVRVRKPDEFKGAFEQGRRYNESLLTAVVSPNASGHARVGLAITKKAVPLAVTRNRIKRHIRESFRKAQHTLPAVDIVVLSRHATAKGSAPELRDTLTRLWKRICESWRASPSI